MEHAGVVDRLHRWSRWLLLGPDNSWGATLATGRTGIYVLAALVLLMHVLDLATGLRMMLLHGIETELNPFARFVMYAAGPAGLVPIKLGVVGSGVLLFIRAAQAGRPRLARNCLLLAAGIGLLGFSSNLVG
jgi:hypothetical protein